MHDFHEVLEARKPWRRRRLRRWTALTLVVVMVATLTLTGASLARVTFRADIPRGEGAPPLPGTAVRYLADNTEYLRKSAPARAAEYIRSRLARKTWQDYVRVAETQIAREEYEQALMSLAQSLALLGEADEAAKTELLLKKGCLLVMLGRFEAARETLSEVCRRAPDRADAHLVMAQIGEALGDAPGVVRSLTSYLALEPDNQEIKAFLERVSAADAAEDPGAAQAGAHTPGGTNGVEGEAETPAVSAFLRGLYAIQEKEYAAAETAFNESAGEAAAPADLYYYRGVCRLSLGRYEDAVEDFTRSIDKGEQVFGSYYSRGMAHILLEKFDDGIADLRYVKKEGAGSEEQQKAADFLAQVDAAQRHSGQMERLMKAKASEEQGFLDAKRRYLTEYLYVSPDDAAVRSMLAQTFFSLERYGEALREYDRLLQDEETAAARYLYGLTALQLGRFEEAEAAFVRSVALDGGEGRSEALYYYRGVCRMSLKKYEEAKNDFTLSIYKKEMVHSCYYNRAICRLMLEEEDAGLADLKLAAEMDEDPDVQTAAVALLTETGA